LPGGGARLIVRWLDRLEEGFMALALVFMTIVTFVQVVLRALGTGFVWSLEATTYAFAWLVLIGMSYGVRTRAHIAVDLVTSKLSAPRARVVAAAALAAGLAYCVLMAYGSAVFVDRLMTLGNDARDIPVPRWLLASILPVGFALLGLRLAQAAWSARGESTPGNGGA
jgi:C4-dicarboxylate transporter DctQ subunit